MSLRAFSKKIKTNYSQLKKYNRGEISIPKKLFMFLLEYSTNKEYWLKNLEEKEDNWGGVKGGEVSSKKNNMSYVRSFRKIKEVNICLNKNFCEFYGAILGDGCISRFKDYEGIERYGIYFSGNKKLDSEYMKYLKKIIEKEFGIYVYYYESKKQNVCTLAIKNKKFSLELNNKFKVPIGLKYGKLKIPEIILNLPWKIKKYVIRGLFDTDGCTLANKREDYKYPWVIITSKDQEFLKQIKEILQEQGYPAYTTKKDVCVRGIENLNKWFKDIGSSNSRNLLKYHYFLKHKFLPAGLLN